MSFVTTAAVGLTKGGRDDDFGSVQGHDGRGDSGEGHGGGGGSVGGHDVGDGSDQGVVFFFNFCQKWLSSVFFLHPMESTEQRAFAETRFAVCFFSSVTV